MINHELSRNVCNPYMKIGDDYPGHDLDLENNHIEIGDSAVE